MPGESADEGLRLALDGFGVVGVECVEHHLGHIGVVGEVDVARVVLRADVLDGDVLHAGLTDECIFVGLSLIHI